MSLPGLKLRPLGRPARGQSLTRLLVLTMYRREISCLHWDSNSDPSTIEPEATDYAIPAPGLYGIRVKMYDLGFSQRWSWSSIFWDIPPSRPLKVNRRFEGTNRLLATCFMLISCLPYSSALSMKAAYTSETPVDFQRTTRRHIP
jgi:hypothetical protein